jgi:hypothetical protein
MLLLIVKVSIHCILLYLFILKKGGEWEVAKTY